MSAIFPEINRVSFQLEEVAAFSIERQHTALAFNLLREVASYVCVAACTTGPERSWIRNQAAVGGNMVRLYKLLSGLLDQAASDRRETSSIFLRLAFETVVTVEYLIANFSQELIESYIRFSLRHERRLRDEIDQQIGERGGEVLPIEDRMRRSLKRAERFAGINLDTIDLKDRSPWGRKDLFQKAQAVGLDQAYSAFFGGMSHSVHGAWQDLYQSHLERDEETGTFRPNLEWGVVRPQPLYAIGAIALRSAQSFFIFIGGEQIADLIGDRFADLFERIAQANEGHEAYLQRKRWPEI